MASCCSVVILPINSLEMLKPEGVSLSKPTGIHSSTSFTATTLLAMVSAVYWSRSGAFATTSQSTSQSANTQRRSKRSERWAGAGVGSHRKQIRWAPTILRLRLRLFELFLECLVRLVGPRGRPGSLSCNRFELSSRRPIAVVARCLLSLTLFLPGPLLASPRRPFADTLELGAPRAAGVLRHRKWHRPQCALSKRKRNQGRLALGARVAPGSGHDAPRLRIGRCALSASGDGVRGPWTTAQPRRHHSPPRPDRWHTLRQSQTRCCR